IHDAIHDLVRCEILLVPTDELDAPVLSICRKQREILHDVEHNLRSQHTVNTGFNMMKLAFLSIVVVTPRPPHVDRHADGSVSVRPSISSKRENVRDEHSGYLLLVDLVHLKRAVEPRHGAACRGLCFSDD